MKIKVKEIPRTGLEIKDNISADEIGLTGNELKVVAPLKVRADIQKVRDVINAEIEVTGKYEFSCARCLESVIVDRKDDFSIHVDIEPAMDVVDLGEEIRQEMLLDISTIVLCKEDCKGICPTCGVNLNLEKCQCKK